MTDEAAIGALTVRHRQIVAEWQPPRKYDVFLGALSWETRGVTALTSTAAQLPPIDLIRFSSSISGVSSKKSDMLAAVQAHMPVGQVLEFAASTETSTNFRLLEEWLKGKYATKNRPLKILVDITCIPKSYILFLVGLSFSRDYVSCFDCIYAAGEYDLAGGADAPVNARGDTLLRSARSLVSLGEWQSLQIPYLTARNYIPGSRDLIVAMGGEVGLSLPFIDKVEPGRLELIFIRETAPCLERPMIPSERAALAELMNAPNVSRTDIGLFDVAGVAREVVAFARSGPSAGTTAMALGSKPHAVAFAVAALSEAKLEVVTRTPTSYSLMDVKPNGELLLIQLEDRFDPCSYIDID